MGTLPEIIDLFSELAMHLQTLTLTHPSSPKDSNSTNIDHSISKFNQSLNITEDNAQVKVLDAALSLMCFKSPQVFDCMIEYLVKTIVSALSSSISCKVLQLENEEVLQIGSFISKRNFLEFIEVVKDVVSKLDVHGMPTHSLLSAVARVAVSSSCCRYSAPSMYILDVKSINRKNTAISKLLCCLRNELSPNNHGLPLRLLSWYLDPLTLKHDISNILQDTMERPLLTLSKEFYERLEWRSILICLVHSPTMFIHSRAQLHNWFMLTGLNSILELLTGLVSVILDLLSRPTWWGIPLELGLKLPSSNAYFPFNHHLLRTMTGPLSSSSFLQLVHGTCMSASLIMGQSGLTYKPSAAKITSVDPKSVWALAICFLDWFYFASVLLFSNNCVKKKFQSKRIFGVSEFVLANDKEQFPAASSAARYIAWILSPDNQSHQDLLFDKLSKISEFWPLRQINSGTSGRCTVGYRKKFKDSKCYDIEEDYILGNECNCQAIGLWLKEFQSIMNYGDISANISNHCGENSEIFSSENHMLFRRVPLGILILCPSYVNEHGFEILLHYAATGRMRHVVQNSGELEDLVLENYGYRKKEAISGACLVFGLTEIVERVSTSIFENEKVGLDVTCLVKSRASMYLIKCLRRLIQLNNDEDGDVMLTDLRYRLEQWRHQGKEMLKINKDIDDVIKSLSHELLP